MDTRKTSLAGLNVEKTAHKDVHFGPKGRLLGRRCVVHFAPGKRVYGGAKLIILRALTGWKLIEILKLIMRLSFRLLDSRYKIGSVELLMVIL